MTNTCSEDLQSELALSPCQGDKANSDLQVGGFGDEGVCQGDAVDVGIPPAPPCGSSEATHPVLPPHPPPSGNPWTSRVPAATEEEDRSHHSVRVLMTERSIDPAAGCPIDRPATARSVGATPPL